MYTVIHEKFIRNAADSSGKYSAVKWVHIVCDTAGDMPVPLPDWLPGSQCDVLADGGSVYQLSSSGEWVKITSGSSGGSIEVDSELSEESTNPVQNKVVTEKINEIISTIGDIDSVLEEVL